MINKSKVKRFRIRLLFCLSVLILLCSNMFPVLPQQAAHIGPEKGWLVLHGGSKKQEYLTYHRFAELTGGKNAPVVVVLTPIPSEIVTPEFLTYYKQWWATELGLTNVTFINPRTRQEADSETVVAPLRNAVGVWIMGGELHILLDNCLGTRTEREIKAVVDRGGIIAGSSAGAMIQGSFLINVTKTPWGAPLPRSRMFLDSTRLVGFGLLKNVTVYPHFSVRNFEKDMMEVMKRYPDLLGIGIDENTAIVVHDDQFEVIGEGRVGIFQNNRTGKKSFYLSKGQKFDLRKLVTIN